MRDQELNTIASIQFSFNLTAFTCNYVKRCKETGQVFKHKDCVSYGSPWQISGGSAELVTEDYIRVLSCE